MTGGRPAGRDYRTGSDPGYTHIVIGSKRDEESNLSDKLLLSDFVSNVHQNGSV